MRRGLAFLVWVAVFGLVVFLLWVYTDDATARRPETNYQKASRIVRAVFPDATEDAALRVVRCETGGTYSEWSYNPSGASGLFQILTGNAGRVLHYHGESLKIRGYEKLRTGVVVNRLFNPWYNAKVALFLSQGGLDFHEWVCQP